MRTSAAPLARASKAWSSLGIIPSATMPRAFREAYVSLSMKGITLEGSFRSARTPGCSKQVVRPAPRAAATEAATVSAFVFSSWPAPSWLMAQRTGVRPLPRSSRRNSVRTLAGETSPTQPKSTVRPSDRVRGGRLDAVMTEPSQPDRPMASHPAACRRETTRLLHQPA